MPVSNHLIRLLPAGLGVGLGVVMGRVTGDVPMWLAIGIALGGGVTALLYMHAGDRPEV